MVSGRPKLAASSLVIGWIDTPSHARVTRPLSASWATTGFTRLVGMAKPMPTEPPVPLAIAVLIADHLARGR